ncbi:hypothetical protein [Serratia fonticola]|uniref:Regulatory protein n=2 Tax=Serratia fonticola TaxID=47917 RepID=A0AAW3WSB7_SERFO|nr:hypothetical protein [Serratia fonticola]MBC3212502.1 hypothetical protein [Serratia fonticola]NYA13855.1 hypothetical protein [Serratia fonticola]NYA33675.1 hypothetical protein [Serratia fonticola]
MSKEPQGAFQGQVKEPVIERITQLTRRYPSRSAAARAWGININTLKSYYRKDGEPPKPRENLLVRIAESEGVSLDWLLSGDDEYLNSPEIHQGGDGLVEILGFLTSDERRKLATMLARKGVETVLYLLDENNIKLLQLPDEEKERLMALHEAKKGAFEDNQDNELSRPTHKAG